MQIPFIKYVEALAACKYSVDTIYDRVNALNVALSGMFPREAVAQVYSTVAATAPDYFNTPGALPDPDWLRELEVIKMVAYELKLQTPEGTMGINGAFEILKDGNMYESLTSLALAKITEEDIELIVNGRYNIHHTTEDIKEFFHYFFNVDSWTLSQKKDYVSIIQETRLRKLYDKAVEGDKDYLVWLCGIAPDKSIEFMLRDMSMDAYYLFKEKMRRDPDEAQKWGQLVIRLSGRIDDIQQEKEVKRGLFEEIQFVISGKNEDDLLETVIDGTGTLAKSKKGGRRHISQIREEEE